MINNWEIVIRLMLSAIIGGSIGVEREISKRPAGLRTHILVSVGSTLIMLVSKYSFNNLADPARIAAQVVSGIGFLGAGTILRTGDNIKGLTTAASLWVCAGIGLAVGSGYYLAAILTSAIVLMSLMSLGMLEDRIINKNYRIIEIICMERPGIIGAIGTVFGDFYITIKDIKIMNIGLENEENKLEIGLKIKIPLNLEMSSVFTSLFAIKGVKKIIYDGNEIEKINR